ncbi:transglycosylase domain-containing protein [Beijerinckia indica]|uniref:Penicillin-binding protein, 1A family n=1 Tax=Beijerinckia indica subsp. indica (strain ATCC 9039 / DSM 1715 / NCIMB 8712) TaxID=395963 RepID=B2IBI2_BEII9|nr:PBP1A family penicillin-binding protein [Beijerinckia indica]ACB96608.1 penicillin-binding protein, 1A family [Beijerinckia indica subsp. indica ATCC 9039]
MTKSEKDPQQRSKKARRRSPLWRIFSAFCALAIWAGVLGIGIIGYYTLKMPPIDQLSVPKRPPNIAILSETGTLIANRGDTGGATIRLADLPPYLPRAFVAIEDRRFYQHSGIDPLGIIRALFRNVAGGGAMQGGSTLTQQLAKNLFLTQERTMARKIQEVILAVWLEHKYSKDQLLELYLNRVYFGSGAYGVEAAAEKYFGHPAKLVTLPEAAMLAGLMKAPTKLAPTHNPRGAAERAAQVVAAMREEGFITESMAQLALLHPAQVQRSQGAGSFNYAADYAMDLLDETIGTIDQDILVTTSISLPLQAAAEKALTEELDRKGARYGVAQGAMVALAPDGAIKALVGGRNYAESQFDRAASAHRQPGSSFKPFVYLAAMEAGLTPDTVRDDAPINIKGWQPENYSHAYQGPVTLTRALSQSLNTVAARLGNEVGPKAVIRLAHRLGIESDLQANASLALGTSEVTPLEITSAYVPFANGGIGVQPHIILKVKTASGQLLYQRKGRSNGRVIDEASLSMMNRMMQETLISGTAHGTSVPGWQAAGKTGTSQDWRDAWFIGYTSHMIAGVWLGNDDNSPTRKASGGTLPVEIWSRFMKIAHQNQPPQPLPGGVWQSPAMPQVLAPNSAPPGEAGLGAPIAVGAAPPVSEAQDSAPRAQAPTAYGAPAASSSSSSSSWAPENDLNGMLPPAAIPNTQGNAARGRGRQPPQTERGLFESLFGG